MGPVGNDLSTHESCECGIIYQNATEEELLQKIIQNSAGDKLPCEKCVYRLIEFGPPDAPHCFICKIEQPEKTYLFKHILLHHIPSKPYKCKYCETKFGIVPLLEIHLSSCKPRKEALKSAKDKLTLESVKRRKQALDRRKQALIQSCKENSSKDKSTLKTSKSKEACKEISKDNTEFEKVKLSLYAGYYSKYKPRASRRELFLCHLCGKYYVTFQSFKDHLRVYEEGKIKCKFSDKGSSSKVRVLNQMRYLHRNKIPKVKVKVECDICNQVVSQGMLKTHKIRKHGTPAEKDALKKHKCSYCGLRFSSTVMLSDHVNGTHTGEKLSALKSSKCKQDLRHMRKENSSKVKSTLKSSKCKRFCREISKDNTEREYTKSSFCAGYYPRREPRKSRGESFVCHLCGKYYKEYSSLKDHLQVHEGKKLKCKFCDKEYLSKDRVLNHMRYAHRNKVPKVQVKVECDICNQSVRKAGLKCHKITKHGTPAEKEALKKHKCSYCGLRFSVRVMLSDHVNSNHTNDKPHICKTCGKAFASFMVFKRHQIIHTGVKNYKCDTCGVSFNQKCTLTRHQVVHTGEKPFECGICGQRFTQKPYMMAHKKKHKEGEVVTKKQKKKKNKQESSEESEEDMSEESEADMSEEDEEVLGKSDVSPSESEEMSENSDE